MDIVQIIMLVTAGGVAYMIYKQIDSGTFEQVHKNKEQQKQNPPAAKKDTAQGIKPLGGGFGGEQKKSRIDELVSKTDDFVANANFKEAKKSIEAALILDPNADNYMRQAFILKNLEQNSEALEALQEVVALDDANDMAYLFMGEIHTANKDFDKAQEAFETALSIDSDFDKTHVEYAKMLLESGDSAKASEHITKALEIDPENEEALALQSNTDKAE